MRSLRATRQTHQPIRRPDHIVTQPAAPGTQYEADQQYPTLTCRASRGGPSATIASRCCRAVIAASTWLCVVLPPRFVVVVGRQYCSEVLQCHRCRLALIEVHGARAGGNT